MFSLHTIIFDSRTKKQKENIRSLLKNKKEKCGKLKMTLWHKIVQNKNIQNKGKSLN